MSNRKPTRNDEEIEIICGWCGEHEYHLKNDSPPRTCTTCGRKLTTRGYYDVPSEFKYRI